MLLIAAISLWWTIFSFTTVAIFLMLIYKFFIHTIPNTKFFYMWTWTTLVFLYLIFQVNDYNHSHIFLKIFSFKCIVIPLLEILVEENIALTFLILGFFICLYTLITRTKKLKGLENSEIESVYEIRSSSRVQNCSICQVKILDKVQHCFW